MTARRLALGLVRRVAFALAVALYVPTAALMAVVEWAEGARVR